MTVEQAIETLKSLNEFYKSDRCCSDGERKDADEEFYQAVETLLASSGYVLTR